MKNFFVFFLACLPHCIFAQYNGITVHTLPAVYNTAVKTTLAIDNANNKWIGFLSNGIAMYNGSTWTSWNSPTLPSSHITSFAFSGSNTWAGSYNGAAYYNGTAWTSYDVFNSGIAGDTVFSIAVHNTDTWFATDNGLSKFDGSNWTTYNTSNSGLPVNYIYSVAVDAAGEVWAGTKLGGLARFNGSTWTVYNTGNSSLPNNNVCQVYIDNAGYKWIGSGSVPALQNVYKFNGTNFENVSQLYPEIIPVTTNPNGRGVIGTGPHGKPSFSCIGFTETTSPLSYYNLNLFQIVSVYQASTGHMWYVTLQGGHPQLYEFDPSQHNPLGLLTPGNVKRLDINEVNAAIMNRGDFHWNTISAGYEVPKGGGANAIFASALWLGGLDAGGNLHQAAMTYRQTGMDFFSGPIDTTNGTADSLAEMGYDYIWKIEKLKIQEFQYYWSTGDVQNGNYIPASDILTWPANGNVALHHMHNLAPFVDVNNNGVYDPLTGGDYPDIKGDEMLYWIFNDNLAPHTETGASPLKVEIHASAYSYYCPNITDSNKVLNYTTYYNFKIYNWSGQSYHDTYIGLFQDIDLGAYDDDYIGCYPPANISFGYNGDANDGSSAIPTIGTYGAHPPVISLVMLDGPAAEPGDGIDNDNDGTIDEPGEHNMMTGYTYYNNDFTVIGNPEHGDDYYNYMTGKWKDSTLLTYGGNGYGGITPTRFMFPSLPYATTGWNEAIAGNTPFDRRGVTSCGPFNLDPGTPVSIDYAAMYTRDTTLNPIDSLLWDLVLHNASQLRNWYSANSEPSCISWNVGIPENDPDFSALKLFPNPASTFLTIDYKPSAENAGFQVLDLTGRVVQTGTLNRSGQTTISTEQLPVGIYAVRIIDGVHTAAVKFIRQ